MQSTIESQPREVYEWNLEMENNAPAQAHRRESPETLPPSASRGGDPPAEPWHAGLIKAPSLSTLLRIFGASVVFAAIGVFLFQNWEAGNDLLRYSMLLSQTVLLCLLGFGTSQLFKEPKSARVFIALGLVSAAASFTILGALLYSTTQWDTVNAVYPDHAFWQVASVDVALSWIAGSMLLLVPVTLVGYLVLARPAAKTLSCLFIANGVLLMLPLRDPALTATVAAVAGILNFMVLARLRSNVPAVRTGEGRIARLIALLPIAIIAGRGGYLYAADAVSVAALSLLMYATLRQLAINAYEHSVLNRLLEGVSLLPAVIGAVACADIASRMLGNSINDEATIAALCTIIVAAMVDLAIRSRADGNTYAGGAALFALLGGVLELVLQPSMGTAVLCVLVSGMVALYTRTAGFTLLYRSSLICLVGALGYHVYFAIVAFDLGGWIGLALLGSVAIVLSAAIERHGDTVRALLAGAVQSTKTA